MTDAPDPTVGRSLSATDHQAEDGHIIGSAELLFAAILSEIRHGRPVLVSLHGMGGLPSSYFNLVLTRLVEAHGADALDQLVAFDCESTLQRRVLARSRAAVTERSQRAGPH